MTDTAFATDDTVKERIAHWMRELGGPRRPLGHHPTGH
jgi:hypothetical protein